MRRRVLRRLIRVYTVCSGLSVQTRKVNTVTQKNITSSKTEWTHKNCIRNTALESSKVNPSIDLNLDTIPATLNHSVRLMIPISMPWWNKHDDPSTKWKPAQKKNNNKSATRPNRLVRSGFRLRGRGGGGLLPIYGIVRMCVPNGPHFQRCKVYE